jgi:nicotinamide mononucleotide adenylyltransferase
MQDISDDHRKARINNPLTYYERTQMIRYALVEAGVDASSFSCSPFPIEHPEDIHNFIGQETICFTTIREPWNLIKIERLRALGYIVEVLLDQTKLISSTQIREMIMVGDPAWTDWIAPGLTPYLETLRIRARLLAMNEE